MRGIKTTRRFRKDYAKLKRSGRRDLSKLNDLMKMLIDEVPLPENYCDHALHGDWQGFRDCHVEGDWILVYQIERVGSEEVVIFCATDNHSNLFG